MVFFIYGIFHYVYKTFLEDNAYNAIIYAYKNCSMY